MSEYLFDDGLNKVEGIKKEDVESRYIQSGDTQFFSFFGSAILINRGSGAITVNFPFFPAMASDIVRITIDSLPSIIIYADELKSTNDGMLSVDPTNITSMTLTQWGFGTIAFQIQLDTDYVDLTAFSATDSDIPIVIHMPLIGLTFSNVYS